MGTTLVGEMRQGSGGLTVDNLAYRSVYHFQVQTDDKTTTREQVLTTAGLPTVGLHYGPLAAVCISMEAERRRENVFIWDITATFMTAEQDQLVDLNNPSNDPTTWIPQFKVIGFVTKKRALFEDKTPASETNQWGALGPAYIRNSAGQPFEEPLTEDLTLAKIGFYQYESSAADLLELMDRNNSVNLTDFDAGIEWGVFPERTLLLNVVKARRGFFAGYWCWRVDYEMIYDPDLHDARPLDVGTSYLDSGTLKPYFDETNTVRINGKLNGTGGKKTGNDYEILRFRIKNEVEFANFIRTGP